MAGFEGTFLMAVASAYFLALNAVGAYLVLELGRTKERLRETEGRLRSVAPRLAQVAELADQVLEADSASLIRSPAESRGGNGREG